MRHEVIINGELEIVEMFVAYFKVLYQATAWRHWGNLWTL